MTLIHLASRLYGTAQLIVRPKLDVILSVLGGASVCTIWRCPIWTYENNA